ncbi:MAG: hypothetical protein P8X57_16515 [Cyclobacteriaceae bacterium]
MIRNIFYLLSLVLLITGCGNDPETQKQRFLIRGNNALTEQNYREAIRFFDEALKIDSCYSPSVLSASNKSSLDARWKPMTLLFAVILMTRRQF